MYPPGLDNLVASYAFKWWPTCSLHCFSGNCRFNQDIVDFVEVYFLAVGVNFLSKRHNNEAALYFFTH
jgi:hypothetical protein